MVEVCSFSPKFKMSTYLDSVGISDVCLSSSRVMSAVIVKNKKGLRKDLSEHQWLCKPNHWCKTKSLKDLLVRKLEKI